MSVPKVGYEKIWNAGQKFNIPFSEVLLTREEMKEVLPEYSADLIKVCVKHYIQMRLNIERFLETKATECGIILPNWNVWHTEIK